MIVYCHTITPRLQYVIDFLNQYYGNALKATSNEDNYIKAQNVCKLNYSYHQVAEEEIWIHPHPLLFESSVRPVKVECFAYERHKAFFKTEGDFPFDIFAAIFYLLTRYEEYLPHRSDSYGRYAFDNSLAYKEGFLHYPLINIWLEAFRKLIVAKDAAFEPVNTPFTFVPTYDIDMAWSYKNKGFKRNAAGMIQSLFKGRLKHIVKRIRVLTNKVSDPFDCYEWLNNLHRQYRLKPVYFFLVAEKKSKFDKNISPHNLSFQELIKDTAALYPIGLHPSWQSGDEHILLRKEKHWLEHITSHNITSSRQHYIRFTLPKTYRRLIDTGITDDYSMGYGSINGFRASIATPFYWYDLQQEQPTKLRIHPFCYMDANSYYEQQLSPEQALEELMHYYTVVKSVRGTLYTIWHNSLLGTDAEFDGWRQVYEQFVATLSSE